jgi:hypothetical protein
MSARQMRPTKKSKKSMSLLVVPHPHLQKVSELERRRNKQQQQKGDKNASIHLDLIPRLHHRRPPRPHRSRLDQILWLRIFKNEYGH